MSNITPRFIVENHGPDVKVARFAFEEVCKRCVDLDISKITLLYPTKQTFIHSCMANAIGQSESKKLCAGQEVSLGSSILMKLESINTFHSYSSYGMLWGVYLMDKHLDLLDAACDVKAISFIPWLEEDGKDWISTWLPDIMVLGTANWKVTPPNLDSEVIKYLSSLTAVVNLSTGIGHPSDKDMAKKIFKTIKKEGHKPCPEDVRKWAIRNGWAPSDARELCKLIK